MEMRALSRQTPVWLFAAFLLTAAGCGSSLYEYQFEPNTDNSYEYSLSQDMNIEMGFFGMEMEMGQKAQQKARVQFTKEEGGLTSAAYTFTEAEIEPTIKSSLPIPDDMINIVKEIYKAMIGQQFTVVLNERGQAVELKGIKEMVMAMIRSIDMPEEALGAIDPLIESSLGDQSISEMMSQMFPFMPEGELDVGAEWESNLSSQGFALDIQCVLTKREDGMAHVAVEGNLSPGESHQMNLPGLGSLETEYKELEGSYKGVYIIDEATGLAVDYAIDMTMNAVFQAKIGEVEGAPAPPTPPINMKISGKTTASLAEQAP